MNEYTMAFSRLWEWRKACVQERDTYLAEMNARLAADCEAAFRQRFPRRQFSMATSRDRNAEEHKAIYDRLKREADRFIADWYDEQRQIKWALALLAVHADVPLADEWLSVYSASESTYRSQGWEARKYARADAENRLKGFLLHIPEGKVEERFHPFDRPALCAGGETAHGWYEYHVMVPTTELGGRILTRKPERPLRDLVRDCWRHGVNPRVCLPFLPYGYEEQVGLDQFGNDVREKKTAIAA